MIVVKEPPCFDFLDLAYSTWLHNTITLLLLCTYSCYELLSYVGVLEEVDGLGGLGGQVTVGHWGTGLHRVIFLGGVFVRTEWKKES